MFTFGEMANFYEKHITCDCGHEAVNHTWYLDNNMNRCYVNECNCVQFSFGENTTSINENGGKQTDVPYAFQLLPLEALFEVARIVKEGAEKYDTPGDVQNWRRITIPEHLNHAVGHSLKHLTGDKTEMHLANAACRVLMALQLFLESK